MKHIAIEKFKECLTELVKFEQPLVDIYKISPYLPYDLELSKSIILTRDGLISILERAKKGQLGAYDIQNHDLEDWASDMICRSAIEFEHEYEDVISDALDFLDALHPSARANNKDVEPEEFQEQIDLLKNAKPEVDV